MIDHLHMEPSTVTAPLPAAIHLKRILVPIDFSAPSQQALKYALRFALANGIAALVKTGRVEGWSLAAEPAIHRRIVDLPMASTLSAHCSSKNRWMREKEEGDFSRDSVEGREGGPVIIEAIGAGDLLGWPRMMPRVRVLG